MRPFAPLCLIFMVACAPVEDLSEPADLGDFRLGYSIVQARDVSQGPFSRQATPEALTTALKSAIDARLTRYDGDGLYHMGVAIGGYVLAQPGVPVVYTPRSVLIFEVNLYDNVTGERLNDDPHRITAFEGMRNVTPLVGSGLARGGEDQLANLAAEGARIVEAWLRDHPEWFAPDPGAQRVEIDRVALDAAAGEAVSAYVPPASEAAN